MPGTLFVVATPIGNLEDISARALRVLREVALIAAEDTRRTAHLLARYAIATPTTSLHEHNEASKSVALIARLIRGESLALVSDAGTPTVSDPGARLVRAALDASIRVEPVPGPSAALAALAASGAPTDTFLFLGFPPTRAKDRSVWLETVRTAGRTVVFFEAPHRVRRTLQDLLRTVGDRRVTLGRELTKAHEQLVFGPISKVSRDLAEPLGEFTVVLEIGDSTEIKPARPPEDEAVAIEFGQLIENRRLSRRQAISEVARRHRLSPNHVYAAVERVKKSVN
jgi:16S rRNA (cytidine1402-2'-O)-methyltransferase